MLQDFCEERIDDVVVITIQIPDATLKQAQNFKRFMQAMIVKEEKKIVINCQGISYMDSTFLGSLVFSLKKMAAFGGELKLVLGRVESPVWTMFETTRMFRVFKIYPDTASAVNSFA